MQRVDKERKPSRPREQNGGDQQEGPRSLACGRQAPLRRAKVCTRIDCLADSRQLSSTALLVREPEQTRIGF